MRRPLLALGLLLAQPFEALADRAFCEALDQVVAAAQNDFVELPRTNRLIPGALEERHGVVQRQDGPPRGAYYAVMYRHGAAGDAAALRQRYTALEREVGGCLRGATALGSTSEGNASMTRWQTPYATIGLRQHGGSREVPEAVIELSVTGRW